MPCESPGLVWVGAPAKYHTSHAFWVPKGYANIRVQIPAVPTVKTWAKAGPNHLAPNRFRPNWDQKTGPFRGSRIGRRAPRLWPSPSFWLGSDTSTEKAPGAERGDIERNRKTASNPESKLVGSLAPWMAVSTRHPEQDWLVESVVSFGWFEELFVAFGFKGRIPFLLVIRFSRKVVLLVSLSTAPRKDPLFRMLLVVCEVFEFSLPRVFPIVGVICSRLVCLSWLVSEGEVVTSISSKSKGLFSGAK